MPFHDEGAEYELDPLYNPRDRETVERYDGPRSYPNKQGEFPGIDDWARVFLPQEDDPEHVKFGKMVQLYTISAAAGHALSGPGGSPSVSNSPAPPAPSSADPTSGQGPNWLDQLLKFGENLLKDKGKDLARLGLGKLYDQFTETPREALEAEILQARRERLADLRRHAKGEFTPRERQGHPARKRAYPESCGNEPRHARDSELWRGGGTDCTGGDGTVLTDAKTGANTVRQL